MGPDGLIGAWAPGAWAEDRGQVVGTQDAIRPCMSITPAYKSLVAWQRADDLFIRLHRLTLTEFPDYERYELGSQLRRAALSVPANIVEGTARIYGRERPYWG